MILRSFDCRTYGIPGSVIGPAFGAATYQGGKVLAEVLRLNMGVKPTGPGGSGTSNLGLLGGDLGVVTR